jgi:hypothetical protein
MMMGHGESEDQDPGISARLIAAVSEVPTLWELWLAVVRADSTPQSEAAKDAAHPLGQHVPILAGTHLSNGLEHLLSWHRLLMPPTPQGFPVQGWQPLAAHVTLIRGCIEGAVMCRWLVDPKADSPVRIQRGVALLLDDYRNRRAWENDRGMGDADFGKGKNAAQRHEDLRKARDDAKIEEVPVLNYTDLFGLYAGYRAPSGGRAMYRLLSAWAHGLQWPMATANFVPIEDGPKVPGGGVGRFSANDEMSAVYTSVAVRLAKAALHELMAYRGLTL